MGREPETKAVACPEAFLICASFSLRAEISKLEDNVLVRDAL